MKESLAGRAYRRKQKRREIREEAHKKIKADAKMHPQIGTKEWIKLMKLKNKIAKKQEVINR